MEGLRPDQLVVGEDLELVHPRLLEDEVLDLEGELDFAGSKAILNGGGLINFSRGELLNAEKASIFAGEDSLTIFAADFDPQTDIKKFLIPKETLKVYLMILMIFVIQF